MTRLALPGIALLALASCGGTSATPDAAAGPLPDAGPFSYRACDPASRVGDFRIQLEEAFTAVSGVVATGVVPGDVPVLVRQDGACRLVQRRNLFCNPACDGQSTCGDGGRCIPYPVGRNVGTVSIRGLAAPVTISPSPLGQRYDYTRLPHPGFQPGAEIVLHASGGDIGPFLLQGRGVTRVELAVDRPVLDPARPFELRWTPASIPEARVAFQIEIDQHGLSRASLQCEVPDQGTATVSTELLSELIKLGASGFPKITVARRTADATTLAGGCVELLVLSAVERPLTVPGHDPCRTDADCPAGKQCALAIQTCR
jgi:hypothetical protein